MSINIENNNNNIFNENIPKKEPQVINSKFQSLYKEIKNQIKNVVIIKLHNQISKLMKEIEKLKKENSIIKNDLVYILKRIIMNKKDYNIGNTNINSFGNNSLINLNSNMLIQNSSTVSLNKSKNSFVLPEKTFNSPISNNFNSSRTKISLIRTTDNINNLLSPDSKIKNVQSKYVMEKNRNKSIDSKIDGYLNSLYRHNFIDNYLGNENNYNLNKSKGLYDELFNSQISIHENQNKKNNSVQKNINISSMDEMKEKGKANSVKKIKYNQFKNINIKLNKYNINKKLDEYKTKNNSKEYNSNIYLNKKNKTNRYFIKKKDLINKDIDLENNNNNTTNRKNNTKLNIININRSPFLVNKF